MLACILWLAPASVTSAQEAKLKFGRDAVSVEQSHAYLQHHAAPDYWKLSSYYVSQVTDSACSLAAITMLLNALRGRPAFEW